MANDDWRQQKAGDDGTLSKNILRIQWYVIDVGIVNGTVEEILTNENGNRNILVEAHYESISFDTSG